MHIQIQRQPDSADSLVRLGDLYARAGNEPGALQAYRKAVDLHPGYLEAWVKIGTQHLRAGRYTDAATHFARAIELNDRLLTGYVGLGVAQVEAGREPEALSNFDLASSIEPNSTLLYTEMARLHLKCGVQQGGGPLSGRRSAGSGPGPHGRFASMISLNSRNSNVIVRRPRITPIILISYYRLGLLLRQRGRMEEAVVHFQRALDINPVYVKALIKLGLALYEIGPVPMNAIETLQQALKLNPVFPGSALPVATMFADKQRFAMAVEHLEQAVAGKTAEPRFPEHLAWPGETSG